MPCMVIALSYLKMTEHCTVDVKYNNSSAQ